MDTQKSWENASLEVFFPYPFGTPTTGPQIACAVARRFVCQSPSPPEASQGPWTLGAQQAGSGGDAGSQNSQKWLETPRDKVSFMVVFSPVQTACAV